MKPDKDVLIKLLLDEKRAYEAIGRDYGVSGGAVRKWAKSYQLDVPRRHNFPNGNKSWCKKPRFCTFCNADITGKGKKFCSIQCFCDSSRRDYWERLTLGLETGWREHGLISSHIRTYLFCLYDNKCCLCGWGEINQHTNKVPLEVHHLDGNYKNNHPSNLQLLCPNCHSLTATYRARNHKKYNHNAEPRAKNSRGRNANRV